MWFDSALMSKGLPAPLQPLPGLPAAGYWPASLRSLTFFQSRSQALDVELRSCSLKDRRRFSFREFLLEVMSNPELRHNKTLLFPHKYFSSLIQKRKKKKEKRKISPGYIFSPLEQQTSHSSCPVIQGVWKHFELNNYVSQVYKQKPIKEIKVEKSVREAQTGSHTSHQMRVFAFAFVCEVIHSPQARRSWCVQRQRQSWELPALQV